MNDSHAMLHGFLFLSQSIFLFVCLFWYGVPFPTRFPTIISSSMCLSSHLHCATIFACHCIIRRAVSYFASILCEYQNMIHFISSPHNQSKRRINCQCEREDTTNYLPHNSRKNTREIARKVQEHKIPTQQRQRKGRQRKAW